MLGAYFDSESNDSLGRERVLVVEGIDDANFFDHLLSLVGADPTATRIIIAKGDVNIAKAVEGIVKSRDYVVGTVRHISLVRDADSNPVRSLEGLRRSLESLGLTSPPHAGFVVVDHLGEERRIGLFLIPSDSQAGMLETILLEIVEEDLRYIEVRNAFNNIEAAQGARFDHREKRLMRLFLAVSDHDCMGAGLAFKRGAFNAYDNRLDDLRTFLRQFLGLD